MSDLEKLIAFDNIEHLVSEETRNKILLDLNIKEEEFEKRLIGKKKEDEFLLFLILLDVCSIMPIDESIPQLLDEASCDFIIQMKDSKKSFMLEIKHTDKEEYKISGGNLQKRIDYANSKGYELYFAISIKGFWMLFNQNYIKEKCGTISIKEDGLKSELDTIFYTCAYLFMGNVKIETIYSKADHPKKLYIKHEDYGNLISYKFFYNEKLIFKVKGKNSQYLPFITILDGLQDRLSSQNQEIKEEGEFTIIKEWGDNNCIYEYTFLLSIISHVKYNENQTYDAHTLIKESKIEKSVLINKNLIKILRECIYYLATCKEVIITYQVQDKGYCIKLPNS